jgi:hypothetical protein
MSRYEVTVKVKSIFPDDTKLALRALGTQVRISAALLVTATSSAPRVHFSLAAADLTVLHGANCAEIFPCDGSVPCRMSARLATVQQPRSPLCPRCGRRLEH